jgi:hypothetical protein
MIAGIIYRNVNAITFTPCDIAHLESPRNTERGFAIDVGATKLDKVLQEAKIR